MTQRTYTARDWIEGVALILAILTVISLVECVILTEYEPPEQDMPGVFHLR